MKNIYWPADSVEVRIGKEGEIGNSEAVFGSWIAAKLDFMAGRDFGSLDADLGRGGGETRRDSEREWWVYRVSHQILRFTRKLHCSRIKWHKNLNIAFAIAMRKNSSTSIGHSVGKTVKHLGYPNWSCSIFVIDQWHLFAPHREHKTPSNVWQQQGGRRTYFLQGISPKVAYLDINLL